MRPKRIAFYGNFGSGNLGNECTLQVVVEHVRQNWPDAQLLCLCTVPDDVQVRHNMKAARAALADSGWTWAELARDSATPPPEPVHRDGAARLVTKMLRLTFQRVPRELLQWVQGFLLLFHADMLVIPGTQIVSDYLCGPSGWPYDIFKWSTLATLCRADLIFLSIGVGPIRHPLSRWLISTSLRVARYRSYRDEHSRRYAASIGLPTERDAVYPDLAFSLAQRHLVRADSATRTRHIVGLGLKDYSGASDESTARTYDAYLNTMADFVAWLHEHDYGVRLLIGDLQYDLKPQREFCELLRRRHISVQPPLLVAESPYGVDELLAQLASTDFVVSPRLHNLILATLLEKPVIALSDHAKLDSLLAELGLADYRVPLEGLGVERLISCFTSLAQDTERVKTHLRGKTERYRHALQEQYARVFPVGSAAA